MGELNQHNLQTYIDRYGCNWFFETGTGIANGLEYACKFPFKYLFSVEINNKLYELAREKIKDERVRLLNGVSIDYLKTLNQVIETYQGGKANCLFWLDAHFPGADFQLGSYDDEYPRHVKFPLESELSIIREGADSDKHVIIIDDLRMMEDGDYELGNAPDRAKYGYDGIKFIEEMFGRSHKITRDLRHQGFLILEPKCCQS